MRSHLILASVVIAAVLGVPEIALGSPQAVPGTAQPAQFGYTGSQQTYKVPSGVLLEGVYVQGAWGGELGGTGQAGATIRGYLPVTPGEQFFVEVGQNGSYGGKATFGGGGAAGSPPPENCIDLNHGGPCGGSLASSGGGATDVQTCSMLATSCPGGGTPLASRLIVAAGAGGYGGGGNTFGPAGCDFSNGPGPASNGQPLPLGNAKLGPLPIRTATGIVIPGFASHGDASVKTSSKGSRDAAMGTTKAGAGGSEAGCKSDGNTYSVSVPGSSASGPDGGTGGNAGALAPEPIKGCKKIKNGCADAGAGGGGGGGYFGGGGGATGMDFCTNKSGLCNSASDGQGGAAGSSFVSNKVLYPVLGTALAVGEVIVRFSPVIEIDVPADGAVYAAGQRLDATWSCLDDPLTGRFAQNCTGTVASGSPIDTTPGKHAFIVKGISLNSKEPLSATVTYTVRS
jgi:hypothetical protein